MAGIAISDERLVMAAAGAKRPSPALMAVILGIDISSSEEIILFFPVDAGGHVTQDMLIGIDEAMAGRDIARRSDTNEPESGAAGMRFVHALMQFGQRVADIREAVMFAAQRIREILDRKSVV